MYGLATDNEIIS